MFARHPIEMKGDQQAGKRGGQPGHGNIGSMGCKAEHRRPQGQHRETGDPDGEPLPAGTPPFFSNVFGAMGPEPGPMNFGHWLGTVNRVEESDINLSSTGDGGSFAGSEDQRIFGSLDIAWDINSVTFK